MVRQIDQPVKGISRPSVRDFATANGLVPKPNQGSGPIDPSSSAWVPRAPVRNAPKSPVKSSSGGGSRSGGSNTLYNSGGGSYGGGVDSLAVSAPSEEDYLKGDATYQAALAALAKQLSNFNVDIDTQLSNRKLDYSKALSQLGWMEPTAEGATGTWNYEDQNTAAGRAYQSMLNDFASRNMIQSQAYGDAQNDLSRSLNDQYEGIRTSNDQFTGDLTRQKTKAADENKSAEQAARAEAILRRAAQYGFGA